ncbi:MAG: DUF1501 domain-containing protein [Vicinamibacteria bacterium]|nr:DUF1501 domain-containing protein [Vicinamibacteria bacterium]
MEKNLRERCPNMDKASAALIRDLKRRGLLDETLVVWGGEFEDGRHLENASLLKYGRVVLNIVGNNTDL